MLVHPSPFEQLIVAVWHTLSSVFGERTRTVKFSVPIVGAIPVFVLNPGTVLRLYVIVFPDTVPPPLETISYCGETCIVITEFCASKEPKFL